MKFLKLAVPIGEIAPVAGCEFAVHMFLFSIAQYISHDLKSLRHSGIISAIAIISEANEVEVRWRVPR